MPTGEVVMILSTAKNLSADLTSSMFETVELALSSFSRQANATAPIGGSKCMGRDSGSV